MTWLLGLYPPRWRRRYGAEFRSLIGSQPFSIGNTVDVIAGAIDAWINPQMNVAVQSARAAEGETTMSERTMKFRCAGYGPAITKADQWKSVALMLSTTLVLTLVWMWLHVRTHGNAYVDSFSIMPMLVGWVLSMRYTHLKSRSGPAQLIFVAGTIGVLIAIFALTGWIITTML